MGVLVGIGPVAVMAHAGGWDEILFVLAPLVLVAALLVAANRRAKRLLAEQTAALGRSAPPAATAGMATGEPNATAEADATADSVPTPGTSPTESSPPTDDR
jgi:hypothetical protein